MNTKDHLSLHDRQIASIRAVIKEGMNLVVATRQDMRSLLQSQKRTEKNLADLIAALGHGRNGGPKS